MTKDGGPAFPEVGEHVFVGDDGFQQRVGFAQKGMTLRDYFAGQALAGYCATMPRFEIHAQMSDEAYLIADEMLKAREK